MSHRLKIILLTAIAVLPISGCIGPDSPTESRPSQDSEWTPHFGLGLNNTHPLPKPGEFAAGPGPVEKWIRVLSRFIESDRLPCAPELRKEVLVNTTEHSNPLLLIDAIQGICFPAADAESWEKVAEFRDHRDSGRIEEDVNDGHAQAGAEWEAAAKSIESLKFGPNATDLEVIARLMEVHLISRNQPDFGIKSWKAFEETDKDIDLHTAFLNILSPQYQSRSVAALAEYIHPYVKETCAPTGHDAYLRHFTDRAEDIQSTIVNDVYRHHPDLKRPAGVVLQRSLPRIDAAEARGWWPVAYAHEARLTWTEEYYRLVGAEHLPTREEANYLLAAYRSTPRTLWGDQHALDVLNLVEAPYEWEGDLDRVLRAYAAPAANPGFYEVNCQPE